MDIREHIDHLRERIRTCGASQTDLAGLSGGVVSTSWINKFLNGHKDNPRVSSLIALEAALDRAERKQPHDPAPLPGRVADAGRPSGRSACAELSADSPLGV